MKVCIINQHIENWGDEAAFLGLSAALNDLQLDLIDIIVNSTRVPTQGYIFSAGARIHALRYKNMFEKLVAWIILNEQFLFPLYRISIRYRKLSSVIDSADIVIVGPGGENIGAYKDYFYLFTILTAIKKGKKVLFAGSSFSHSRSKSFNLISTNILKMTKVLAREQFSFDYLKTQNINVSLCSDNALYLKKYFSNETNAGVSQVKALIGANDYTVFVPNCLWSWHPFYRNIESKNYLTSLIDNIFKSLASYGRIVILPQTYPYPNHKEMFDYYTKKYSALVLSDLPSLDQIKVISHSQAIVGMRYHTIVFAALANTRCFSIAYERKILGFNKKFFHGKGLLDITKKCNYDHDFHLPSIDKFPSPDIDLVDKEICNLFTLHKDLLSL